MSTSTSQANPLDGQAEAQPSPPAPPPLPPQRYGHRAATAIARLAQPFLYPSRPSSAQDKRYRNQAVRDGSRPGPTRLRSSVQRSSSPSASRSVQHKCGLPIAAFDISPEKTHAVLAGSRILKTIRVDPGGSAAEDVNIRTKIIAYAAVHSSSRLAASATHKDRLAAHEVRWSNGNFDSIIATAAASGRIIVYDLNRASLELTALQEHARLVHKLAFSPFKGELLLSGSQDGSIKLWDLRVAPRDGRSQTTFFGHDQGVRTVKWSSTDGVEFATGTDSGVVQRWDIRKRNAPIIKLNAHDKTCHSVDYHPGGKHLASAGADRLVKVWDTTRTDRRQNTCWTLQAPQPVVNVRWRPDSAVKKEEDAGLDSGPGAYIATSYDCDPRIHVWDFRRPHIPFQEIDKYDTPATSIIWRSEDLLWSVGSAGMFTQTDLNWAAKTLEKRNVNVLAVASNGGLTFFSDARPGRKSVVSLPEAQENFLQRTDTGGSSGERLGSSLSANEASFDEGGLLTSTLRRRRKKAAALRLLAGVPRNSEDAAFGQPDGPLNLDPVFETTQLGAYGRLRSVFDLDAFTYLANHYETPDRRNQSRDTTTVASMLEELFLKNSDHATCAHDDGLAHTWRILAWTVRKELEDWAKLPESQRTRTRASHVSAKSSVYNMYNQMSRTGSASTARNPNHLKSPAVAMAISESGSNVPTPRLKPLAETSDVPVLPRGSLGDDTPDAGLENNKAPASPSSPRGLQQEMDDQGSPQVFRSAEPVPVILPPAPALSMQDLNNVSQANVSGEASEATSSPVQTLQATETLPIFADLEEQLAARRAAISNYRMTPRPVLKLDGGLTGQFSRPRTQSPAQPINVPRPGLERYDSSESFNMLSESADSHSKSLPLSSFDGGSLARTNSSLDDDASVASIELHDRSVLPELERQFTVVEREEVQQDTGEGRSARSESLAQEIVEGNSGQVEVKDSQPEVKSRQPSLLMRPIIHEEERDERSVFPVPADSGVETPLLVALHSGRPPLNYFKHAINLDMAPSKPWHASSFLPALLSHHLDHLSSAQLPAMLALYLQPYYPSLFPTSFSQEQHIPIHEPNVLTPRRLDAVLLSYHAQLVSMQQHVPAAEFRRACEGVFPVVGVRVSPGSVAGWWCRTCERSNKGAEKGRCARCRKQWDGCMVCARLKTPASNVAFAERGTAADSSEPLPETNTKRTPRWTYCQTCGHGGHSSCLTSWFANNSSAGTCAVPGCLHDCVPGARREEVRLQLAHHKAEQIQLRRGTGVLRDERVVKESKAVKAARPMEMDLTDEGSGAAKEVLPMETVAGPPTKGRARWRSSVPGGMAGRKGRGSIGSAGLVAGAEDESPGPSIGALTAAGAQREGHSDGAG